MHIFHLSSGAETTKSIRSSLEEDATMSMTSLMTSSKRLTANQDKAAIAWCSADCELYRKDYYTLLTESCEAVLLLRHPHQGRLTKAAAV